MVKRLTETERRVVFHFLLERSTNGKLKNGSMIEASHKFSCSTSTVQRIWVQAKNSFGRGLPLDVSSKLKGRVGRKKIEIDRDEVSQVPLRRRTNIRSLACAINMAKSTLRRRIKEGGNIRSHTNAIKPHLTNENKMTRLAFCLRKLKRESLDTNPEFEEMFDVVHIDEKWFFQTKETERYYLLPEETDPVRTCKSKRFITKIMFLAAVARPQFDEDNNILFDGKIGIFPFVYKEPAQRSSKNRIAGTLETKACTSVTKDVYRSCLLHQVLPQIRQKWPLLSSPTIYIQQDNARPHIRIDDDEFIRAAKQYGFDINLVCQPPNSPDLNVLDLGFFRSIQTLQHQEAPKNIDELQAAVEKAFNELSPHCLNNVFLSLQSCMVQIIKSFGDNRYKVPHMGKGQLARVGNLPVTMTCDVVDVQQAAVVLQTQ